MVIESPKTGIFVMIFLSVHYTHIIQSFNSYNNSNVHDNVGQTYLEKALLYSIIFIDYLVGYVNDFKVQTYPKIISCTTKSVLSISEKSNVIRSVYGDHPTSNYTYLTMSILDANTTLVKA